MDVRTGFFAVLVVGLGVVGYLMVAPFLQYVLGAALLAFVLYPVHRRLAPRVGPRVSAITLTAAAFVVAIVPMIVFSLIILSTALEYVDRIEEGDIEAIHESARTVMIEQLGLSPHDVAEIESTIQGAIEDVGYTASEFVLSELVGVINTTIHTSFGLMILAFLLYYFLVDGREFVGWIRQVTPLRKPVQKELEGEISNVTWAVIHSHLLVAIVEGVLGGIGLYLVGVSNVAFWTVVMIVVSIMPVIGVWLVWAPAVGYLLLTGDVVGGLLLLAYGVAVLSVVDNYLRAIFVDRGSGLHPAVVLVGVIGGIYLLGILGLFLGPVLLAVFKASLTVFSENWTELASPESEPTPTPQRAE
ncbi:AI-2E family transporter [Halovivax gelatinilyticus]|uniref:AI-2E family transporter n=1 Tax=Halovivax gelatinilyticus TaxID=2961597 RepID=UPI0020CA33D3|nr:AI-2E family transporter [Halovivax gelatinilyticus]